MSAVQPSSAELAESLLAFWSEAGVDAMLLDAPVDRIAAGKIAPPPPPPGRKAAPVAAVARPSANQPDISAAVAQAQELAASAETLDALVAAIPGSTAP